MSRITAPALAALAVLCLLAWPLWTARSQERAPATAFEPLTLEDASLGEFLEGDAPIERLAPLQRAASPQAVAQDELPRPEGLAIDFSEYSTPEQINAFLRELEAEYPHLVEVYVLGTSWHGREILGIRVANEDVPGSPVESRPAMYTDAQHHARELISKETTLYTLWWLISQHGQDDLATYLVDTRAAYFVPSVNVDGNHIVLADNQDWRKSANPTCCDDDEDGAVDEDPPVGYGYGAFNLARYTFTQEWIDQNPDDPFVNGWWRNLQGQPENLGRFRGDPNGDMEPIPAVDADGDGEVWEDPIGGVDTNRNYDWFWEGGDTNIQSGTFHGPEVWSEPQTQAVRDFVESLPHLATGISYHSGIDLILFPWGYSREADLPDAELFERLGRKGSELTEVNGVPGSPHVWTARGLYGATGSTMDWLYGKRGIYAFSPEVYGGDGTLSLEKTGALTYTIANSTGASFNPPPSDIVTWADRWRSFALMLLAATPNVELASATPTEDALVLQLTNDGFLPVDIDLRAVDASGAEIATGSLSALRHDISGWSIPIKSTEPTTLTISMSATLQAGTVPHVVETATWTLIPEEGTWRLAEGTFTPQRDLGAAFGGWYAGPEWGTQAYTCGPGGCSNIRLPEDQWTPTPVPPTPTATPPPPPSGLFLPRLLNEASDG